MVQGVSKFNNRSEKNDLKKERKNKAFINGCL